ncbi:MAG: tetraacyldisaccharide 4'-kinase [Planctomycetota bacterium]|jgi:tetraacyldisaccharide 4'-kinase
MDADRAEQLLAGPVGWIALLPWLIYRPLVWARNRAFDLGLRRIQRLPCPVFSVGNIGVGGTGKTPVVAALGDLLGQRGRQPAVLSRGYRAGADGSNEEARMLNLPVHCDPQRYRGGQAALAAGADVLILDDGFQHRQLQRDCDLICLDATRPWGRRDGQRGRTLPLGLLREGPAALHRASALIITRCDQVSADRLHALERSLQRLAKPILHCRHAPHALRHLDGSDGPPLTSLDGSEVTLISGIGNPSAFAATARSLGCTIRAHQRHDDHHHFTTTDLERAAAIAPATTILCTSKDAVKLADLSDLDDALRQRVLVVEVAAAFRDQDLTTLNDIIGRTLGTTDDQHDNRQ